MSKLSNGEIREIHASISGELLATMRTLLLAMISGLSHRDTKDESEVKSDMSRGSFLKFML